MGDIKEKWALDLANEISFYKLYEVDEIVKVIMPYFKMMHQNVLETELGIYEKEYQQLVQEQIKTPSKYCEIGLLIAKNKAKRLQLRTSINNEKRLDLAERLKIKLAILNKERDFLVKFIKDIGDDSFNQFVLPELIKIQEETNQNFSI